MSEVKKIATRVSYGNALVELAKEHDDVYVLDADLAAATQTAIFKKEFPDRHIDCGIAECNMMGIAAGLAATGKVPFASSFAMFAAGRAFEQVRNSIGYPHLNVKIGATHAISSAASDVYKRQEKLYWISSSQCENRCDTRRYFGRRGWSHPPVQRGYCTHESNSRHGCNKPK